MKKSNITVNFENNTLEMSKAFYKRACVCGSDEYYELRKYRAENEGFTIVQTEISKKTYRNLTLMRMEEYIMTQPNSEARLLEFKAIQTVAKAKGSLYPTTKKWFFETYKEYKNDDVIATDEAKEIVKKAEAEKANKIMSLNTESKAS